VITLNGDAQVTVLLGVEYTDAGAIAADDVDGSVAVTTAIQKADGTPVNSVDVGVSGGYVITYTAEDAAGNSSSAQRTVTVTTQLFTGRDLVYGTTNTLVGGAKEYSLVSKNSYDWRNTSYLCEIDLSSQSYKIMSSYGLYDASSWKLTTLSKQAAAAQAYFDKTSGYEGYQVVGILNADFFNMATGEPSGALVMNGAIKHTANGRPYFAVLNDGTAAIREGSESLDDCVSAAGGDIIILKDGEVTEGVSKNDGYKNIIYSRSAIGIKADGTVVTFCTKGFRIPDSYGLTYSDVAAYLKTMGCVDALMLDGGGSAQWSSTYEGSGELAIRNSPSDGNERGVSSALMLVAVPASEKETFSHATLTPNNEIYTPGSTVQFTASGVSTNGNPIDLPSSDITWEVASGSTALGSIDQNGKFTATEGKTGRVTVHLKYKNQVVGTTSITLADPDELYFTADSINLDWGQVSDLGLNVKRTLLDINYGGNDFTWSVESTTEDVGNSDIGTVADNHFTAGTGSKTLKGTVTVSYTKTDGTVLSDTISVEIGKSPIVLLDFESNTEGEKAAQYCWGHSYFSDNPTNGYGVEGDQVKSPITVTTSGKYSAAPTEVEITKPYRFTGYWNTTVPSADIFEANGYHFYTWANGAVPNPKDTTAEIVTANTGKVRFGQKALAFNYDYTQFNASQNGNIGIRNCGGDINIEGTPTALGMWVYAPEGTPNFWLYTLIYYWDGSDYVGAMVHFTTTTGDSTQYSGINWSGWMYLEADLTGIYAKAIVDQDHPLKIVNGGYIIDIGFVRSSSDGQGNMIPFGAKTAGTIYIDNIRAVYGSTTDDLVNPVISSITANGTALTGDNVSLTSGSQVRFVANYADADGKNASGISNTNTYAEIDGQKVSASAGESALDFTLSLPNGSHSITITVVDNFGNETSQTRYFTVDDSANTLTSVNLSSTGTPVLGGQYTLTLTASNLSSVSSVSLTTEFDQAFGEPTVAFSNEYKGSSEFKNGKLTLSATALPDSQSNGDSIATITFSIPETLAEGTAFTYRAAATYQVDDNSTYSFAGKNSLDVGAAYTLTPDILVKGMTGTITVQDSDGNAVSGVSVYVNGSTTPLGKTDSNGQLAVTVSGLGSNNSVTLYAKGSAGVSYRYTAKLYNAGGNSDGAPSEIQLNATADPTTTQNITWISNPTKAGNTATVRYAVVPESGEPSKWKTVTGSSILNAFNTTSHAALLNSVTLTGLTPGTKYAYQVGNGTNWSGIQYFTTDNNSSQTNFFVIGDTQLSGNDTTDAEYIQTIQNIAAKLKNTETKWSFGLQTGDFIDNGGNLTQWQQILNLFDTQFSETPFIHVLGNHEYYGDADGAAANALFGHDETEKDYYSVTYGNVYIAVINNSADLNAAAEWLKTNAEGSDATWKILTLHQPPYYTNTKGSSEAFHNIIAPAAEEAGIDLVFSGHDHSYARTAPMKDGKVAAQGEGTAYFICGDLGEKSRASDYAITNNSAFHFEKATQDYTAIYLTVSATDSALTVNAYDVANIAPIDSYTLSRSAQS
jgi:exopolysaccharide biosynthesis protein